MTPERIAKIREHIRWSPDISKTTALPDEEVLWLITQAEALERKRSGERRRSASQRAKKKAPHA